MAGLTRIPKGSGKRRRYRGKTVAMVRKAGKLVAVPRSSTHGGHSPARAGWTCGDTASKPEQTKHTLGQYKVGAPTKRVHRKGPYGSIS